MVRMTIPALWQLLPVGNRTHDSAHATGKPNVRRERENEYTGSYRRANHSRVRKGRLPSGSWGNAKQRFPRQSSRVCFTARPRKALADDFLPDYKVNGKKSLERAKYSAELLKEYFGEVRASSFDTAQVKKYIEIRFGEPVPMRRQS